MRMPSVTDLAFRGTVVWDAAVSGMPRCDVHAREEGLVARLFNGYRNDIVTTLICTPEICTGGNVVFTTECTPEKCPAGVGTITYGGVVPPQHFQPHGRE